MASLDDDAVSVQESEGQTLKEFLSDIDLEEYIDKLEGLGVKKPEHLKYIKKENLQEINMLPLEIPRIMDKINKELINKVKSPSACSVNVSPKITVPLPSCSSVFGHTVMDISESKLIADYKELYYMSPVNYKQRQNNAFILQMVSGNRYRFNKKRELMDWARKERERRLDALITFTDDDNMKKETEYFKEQNLLYKLSQLKSEYKDILNYEDKELPNIKIDRFSLFKDKVSRLIDEGKNCYESILSYQSKLSILKDLKEETTWWRSMGICAEKTCEQLKDTYNKFERICVSEKARSSFASKSTVRKGQKNKKKNFRKISLRKAKNMVKSTEVPKGRFIKNWLKQKSCYDDIDIAESSFHFKRKCFRWTEPLYD